MDLYQRATTKGELSHWDLARIGKITCTLEASCIVFGLTDDLTDLTEVYLLRKKSNTFFRLKKYAAKQKSESNFVQKFRSDNGGGFDSTACRK